MTQTDNLRPGHKGPRNPEAPDVTVAATVSAAAGKPAAVPVRVVHRGKAPARIRVTIFGLDARWAPPPLDLGILQPGDAAAITLTILPERGSLGASYPFTIAAEASSPATMSAANGRSRPVVGVAEATLVLDAAERVSMSLAPATPSAVFSRGIRVNITNPSGAERTFTLVPSAAAGASLRLRQKSVTIPAQQTVTVPGRLRVKKPTIFGGDNTHTFSVSAQGTGAPEWVEGTLRSKPLVGGGARAVIGLVAIVAVWAALAVVFIPKISNAVKSKNEVTTSSTADGGSGSDGAGAKGGANGAGDGSGANGGAGSGDGTAAGDSAGANGGHPAGGYVVSGTVTGSGAAGASATLQPVSLSGAGDDGSLPAVRPGPGTSPKALRGNTSAFTNRVMPAVDGSDDGAIGKIRGPVASVNRDGFRTTTLLTTDKGEFTFGGVTAPGYYLLTLGKAGYQTQRFLINSANLASPQPMKVQLDPGAGKLSGSVTGPGGAIGAATIVVTDGTVTLQTSSISASTHTGTPGTWTLDQVSTPGTYLVTASAPGLGSASKLVTLDASGSAQVDLQLSAGQGSIVGKVSGEDSLGAVGGLGGITVTAKGGDTTRTATTVTSAAMRGAFVLPNLPAPGDYTLTISGPGFLTQTRDVSLGASGGTVTVNATLSRADAVVAGMVTGLDANGKAEGGLGGVGLTLASNDVTMKTMTTSGSSAGSYQFTGVAPGSYVLTAVQFGRVTGSATVELAASSAKTVNLALKADIGAELPATAHIRGQVIDSRSSGPLTCDRALETVAAGDCVATVTVTAPKDPADESKGTVAYTSTATAALNYVYTIPDLNDPSAGLPPGLYTVTVKAPGYEDTVTHVQVAQGQTIPAPAASMPPLGIISGTVTTRVGTPAKASCVIAVPAGVSIPSKLPTSCALAADGNTCTATGITGAQPCALTSMGGSGEGPIGTYQIRGLTHGQYTMLLIAQDPEYTAVVNAPPIVTLDLGGDGQFNTVLDRLGRINLFVVGQDIVSGALAPAGAVPVKVTPTPALGIDTQNTAADGTLVIKGLNGRYSLAADAADRGSAQVANLAVGLNQEIDLTMTLTRSVGAFIGTVKADINGVKEPVAGVKVTIVGTVDYRSQTAVPGSVTVTTDADGCYAVKAQTTDLVPTNEACTQLAASPGSVGVMSFKSTHVTLNADTTGTATTLPAPMNTEITLGADASKPGTLPTMLLVADPPPFSTAKLTASGPTGPITAGAGNLDLSSATLTVTGKPAGARTVTITSAADGTLTFNDSGLAASNKALPGTYTIQVQRAGFAPLNLTLTCTWSSGNAAANACVYDNPPTLLQLPEITGAITVPAPLPSDVTVNNLATKMTVARTTPAAGGTTVTLGTPEALDAAGNPLDPNLPVDSDGNPVQPVQAKDANGNPIFNADGTPEWELDANGNQVMEPVAVSFWRLPITYADPANSALAPLPMDMAAPGSYTFNVALSGYATVAVTVECGADYTGTPVGGSGTVESGCTTLSTTLGALPRFNGNKLITLELSGTFTDTDFSMVTATVNGQPDIALTVDTAANDGTVHWKDNRSGAALPQDVVAPGTYAIVVNKPGYAPADSTLVCPDATTSVTTCKPSAVTLQMYPVGSGTVKVNALLPGDPAPIPPTWSDAIVTIVAAPGNTSDISVTLAADDPDNSPQTAVMTWIDTSLPTSLEGIIHTGNYTIKIAIPGYATGTVSFACNSAGSGAKCQPTDADGNPTAITLDRLPAFTGKVAAEPALTSGDLTGAKLTVSGLPSGVGSVDLTSDKDGNLTWVETKNGIQQPANIVTPGATAYQISATLDGYLSQTNIPFKCDSTGADATCDLAITMKASTLLTFELRSNDASHTAVTGAKITFQGTGVSPTTVQLDDATSTYTYSQDLDPTGSYTATIRAPGFKTITINGADPGTDPDNSVVQCDNDAAAPGLHLGAGGKTTCTVTLTALGKISGFVVRDSVALADITGAVPSTTKTGLPDVTVTAKSTTNSGPTFTGISQGVGGTLTITGDVTSEGLKAGQWTVTASLAGYSNLSGTVTIGCNNGADADSNGYCAAGYKVSAATPNTPSTSTSYFEFASGQLTIHLVPNVVKFSIHLAGSSGDITPTGTAVSLEDAQHNVWICTISGGSASTKTSVGTYGGTGTNHCGLVSGAGGTKYVQFTEIPPGDYKYSVSSSTYADTGDTNVTVNVSTGASVIVSMVPRASTVSGKIVETLDSTALIGGATVKMCTTSATATTCQAVNNFDGNKVLDTSSSAAKDETLGTFQFTNIKDGDYKLVASHNGYVTAVSTIITVKFGTDNSGIVINMSATTRQNLVMTLTAPSGLDLKGASITLTQQAPPDGNDGRVTKDLSRSSNAAAVAGSGTPATQYTSSLSQVNTGKYDVTVLMGSAQAPFELSAGSVTVTAGTADQNASLTVAASTVTLTVSWTGNACSATPSTIPLRITDDATTDPIAWKSVPPATVAGSSATAVVYLPADTFAWEPTPTSLPTGWMGSRTTLDTTASPATGISGSITGTSGENFTATFTVDDTATSGATIVATDHSASPAQTITLSDDGSGDYSTCLPGTDTGRTWMVSANNPSATTPIVGFTDVTVTVTGTTASPPAAAFAGYTISPSVSLSGTVTGHDSVIADLSISASGGTSIWSTTNVSIPSTGWVGTSLRIVPAGSYTFTASVGEGQEGWTASAPAGFTLPLTSGAAQPSAAITYSAPPPSPTPSLVTADLTVNLTAGGAAADGTVVTLTNSADGTKTFNGTVASGKTSITDIPDGATYNVTAVWDNGGTTTHYNAPQIDIPAGTTSPISQPINLTVAS